VFDVAPRRLTFLNSKLRKLTEKTVVLGVFGLIWLIFRSGTKPSRIVYPCQKAAASISYTLLLHPFLALLGPLLRCIISEPLRTIKSSRTKFLVLLILLVSVSLVFSGLAVYTNYVIADPKELLKERTVSLEKAASVSVVRVEDDNVGEALHRAISNLGGIEKIIPEGSKVLIKPNIVRNQAPPDTSDPAIVKAVADLVRKRKPSVIWIADGSGEGNTTENFLSLGFLSVAEQSGAKLVDLNYGEMVDVIVPGGGVVFNNFTFNRIVAEADVFISVACMKTHSQAVITLGMKNLIGLGPGSIYGFPKSILHEAAENKGDNYMAGVIVDLSKARKIDLVIIDGRVGMEGQGPHEGTPVQLGLLIVGTDPVATDSVASAIMGFDPEKLPSTKMGFQEGLGTNDLRKIDVKEEKLEDVFHAFKPASGHDSFQIISSSYLVLHRTKTPIAYVSAISWISTVVFFILSKEKLKEKQ